MTREDVKEMMFLGATASNLSLLPAEERRQTLIDMVGTAVPLPVFQELLRRKQELFADDTRFIGHVDVEEERGQFRVIAGVLRSE